MHKLGLCSISDQERPLDELLEIASNVGFDGFEVWGKPPHVPEVTEETARSIAERGADLGLEMLVYGSYLRPGADDYDERWEDELAFADALGADLIRVWAGEQDYGEHTEAHWDQTIADLEHLGPEAERRDIEVTVERHAGSLTHPTEGARRVVEAVDHPNCGLNWQLNKQYSPEEVLADVETLAPLTNNIHHQFWPEPDPDGRSLLENTYFDVTEVMRIMRRAGFDGHVEIEFVTAEYDYEEALEKDLEALRSLLQSLDAEE